MVERICTRIVIIDKGRKIAEGTSASTPRMRGRRPWLFRRGESRVVSLLIRAQFRNDQKFRMAVFGVLPMTIVYMFLSFRDGVPPDPLSGRMDIDGWGMISVAIFFFPMMVRMGMVRSDAWRASWIYFGTPESDPRRRGGRHLYPRQPRTRPADAGARR